MFPSQLARTKNRECCQSDAPRARVFAIGGLRFLSALGITSWTGLCRLLCGDTLKLRELEYIQAAQSVGVSSPRILTRHILPNVTHIVLILLVMDFSGLVLAEAVLCYVGVSVGQHLHSVSPQLPARFHRESPRRPASGAWL